MDIPNDLISEQTLEYTLAPTELTVLQDKIQSFMELLQETEKILEQKLREIESTTEQSYFKEDLLNDILSLCEDTSGTKKDMIKEIKLLFAESEVEL